MRTYLTLALPLFTLLVLTACGPPPADFSGQSQSFNRVTAGDAFPPGTEWRSVLTLEQDGKKVTGRVETPNGQGGVIVGEVTGTVKENVFTFTIEGGTDDCPFSVQGTATGVEGEDGSTSVGSYTGTNCNGSWEAETKGFPMAATEN